VQKISASAQSSVPVTETAGKALQVSTAGPEGGKGAMEAAEVFLQSLLATGPLPVKDIEAAAEGAGLSWRTVRRAKDRLGVRPSKSGLGGWSWSLAKVTKAANDETAEDGQGGQ
jgi:hypothetical protein